MSWKKRILFLAFCLIPWGSNLEAQVGLLGTTGTGGKPSSLVLEGDLYDYNRETEILSYHNPKATFGDAELMAKNLVYDKKKGILEFTGQLVIRAQNYLITAQRGSYDLNFKLLEADSISLYDYVNQTYLSAKRLVQKGPQRFDITDATLTVCNPDQPAWQFYSSFIAYDIDNYAYSVHTVLTFYELPILYLPATAWPTKKGRASGFLAPLVSSKLGDPDRNKNYGSRVQIPYFWAIDKDQDLTFTPDLIQRRGTGLGLDYRWAFVPGMAGEAKFWGVDENLQQRNLDREPLGGLTKDQVTPFGQRYDYSFDHRQNLGPGQLFLHQDGRSDNEVEKEYQDLRIGTQNRYNRGASWVAPWSGGGLTLAHEQSDAYLYPSIFDRSTDADTHLSRVGYVAVNQRFNTIAGSPLSLGSFGSWADYQRRYGWKGNLSTAALEAEFPFHLDFLNLIPSGRRDFFQLDPTYSYNRTETEDPSFVTRNNRKAWSVDKKRLETNFEVFQVFTDAQGWGKSRVGFRPRVIYEEVSDVDQRAGLAQSPYNHSLTPLGQGEGPAGDYRRWGAMFVAPLYSYQTLTYKLETRYLTKDRTSKAVRSFFTLDFTQPYNLGRKKTLEEIAATYLGPQVPEGLQETKLGNPQMPLRVNLGLSPIDGLTLGLFYRYDHELGRMVENRVSLGSKSFEGHSLTLGYTDNNKAYMELDGTNHAQAKTYSLDQIFVLTDRQSLHLMGQWDLSRSDAAYLYSRDNETQRLERQLTKGVVEWSLGHSCFDYKIAYQEEIILDQLGNQPLEALDRRITFAMVLAKWPSSSNPYQRNLRY